jgi:hypothetical protein
MWTLSTTETIAFIALVAGMAALWAPRGPLRAGLAMKEVAEISAINRLGASVVRWNWRSDSSENGALCGPL